MKLLVRVHGRQAGILEEVEKGKRFTFNYFPEYHGSPVSLTLPVIKQKFEFDSMPPFFEGVLPEGMQLEALLKQNKIDRDDLFSQLLSVGQDLVGAVTVEEFK